MAAILTPSLIWKDFQLPSGVNYSEEEGFLSDNLKLKHVYIEGRAVKGGNVKIYGAFVTPAEKHGGASVLIVQDFSDGNNLALAMQLAQKGYDAFLIDLAGFKEGKERYTVYPESVKYANLAESVYGQDELSCDVTSTCWYEWCAAVIYAAAFLRERKKGARVGAIGIGGAATALWQAAAVSGNFDCVVFSCNSGWYAYRGINKFGGVQEPGFSDGTLSFIAGVEPQSYARQIKCPILILAPTNSPVFPCDRAYDTVARTEEGVYTAVRYSVGGRNTADCKCFACAEIFLENFLHAPKGQADLPGETEIKGEFREGKLFAEVKPCTKDLKSVRLYVAEQTLTPKFRSWRKIAPVSEGEVFSFEYEPYEKSGSVVYFAEAEYKNGFGVCSIIEERSFAPETSSKRNKHRIIYSSRRDGVESMFGEAVENTLSPHGLDILPDPKVQVAKGPMDLYGLYGVNGLMTFRIIAEKFRPEEDSLMMLDVYIKGGGTFTVRLIADYYGAGRTEYSASASITGGEVWQNVKFEKNRFKTAEGMSLKNYDKIEAIEFYADGDFLINNALWV